MKMQKLIRQYGEHGNEYSLLEVGDKVNELIDFLSRGNDDRVLDVDEVIEEKKVEFQSLVSKNNYTPLTGDMAVRSNSSQDRVYLIRDGKKHWIRNPETLFKLGFNFHNVKNITNDEMDAYETGEDMNLKEEELIVQKPTNGFDKYNI